MRGESARTMTRYLLGELPEAERASYEERYFSNPRLFEALEQVESGLIDDYVRGRLAPDVRRQFQSSFMATPERLDKVRFAATLAERLDSGHTAAPTEARPVTHLEQRPQASVIFQSKLANGLAFAAVAVLAVTVWFVIDAPRTRHESVDTDTTVTDPGRQTRDTQPPATETVVALSLAVGPGERTIAPAAPPTLGIPRGAETVRFDVQMQEPEDPEYTAIIRAIGGPEIFRRTGLAPAASGSTFSLTVPATRLAPGDYMLTLQRTTPGGETEDLSQTHFRVDQR